MTITTWAPPDLLPPPPQHPKPPPLDQLAAIAAELARTGLV